MNFTETIIDIADCYTTLHYHGNNAPAVTPLSLRDSTQYTTLYNAVVNSGKHLYSTANPGVTARIIDHFTPVYHSNKYWEEFFSFFGGITSADFANLSWDGMVPLQATLNLRIEPISDSRFQFKISPTPRVLLYPFGWSTWLSLRITGTYSLDNLAQFMTAILKEKLFKITKSPEAALVNNALSVRDFFQLVAIRIREDCFDAKTKVVPLNEIISVTTVLAKYGGTLSLGALTAADESALKKILNPLNPANDKISDFVYSRTQGNNTNFVLRNRYGSFIWQEGLLKSVIPNKIHLRCYHNNTFYALNRAVCFHQLLAVAEQESSFSTTLSDLLKKAWAYLDKPPYTNTTLDGYSHREDVEKLLARMKKRLNIK